MPRSQRNILKNSLRGKRLRRNQGNRGGRNASSGMVSAYHPVSASLPDIDWTPSQYKKFRFYGSLTESAGIQVTRGCLLSLMVGGIAAATTCLPLITGARIVSVRLTLPGVTAPTVPQNVKFEWISNDGKPTQANLNNSSTAGNAVVLTPPANSRTRMWSKSSSTDLGEVMFQFNSTDQTIGAATNLYIDLIMEIVLGSSTPAIITMPATTVAGGITYAALDCLQTSGAVGTWIFFPIGVETPNGSNVAPVTFTRSGG